MEGRQMELSRKMKGSIGIARAIASFVEAGFSVFVPIVEQSKYDFLVEKDNKIARIQVKFASLNKDGFIELSLKSVWTDTKQTHVRNRKSGDYDILVGYCPELQRCFTIADKEFKTGSAVRFRWRALDGNVRPCNTKRIRWAKDYMRIDRTWKQWIDG